MRILLASAVLISAGCAHYDGHEPYLGAYEGYPAYGSYPYGYMGRYNWDYPNYEPYYGPYGGYYREHDHDHDDDKDHKNHHDRDHDWKHDGRRDNHDRDDMRGRYSPERPGHERNKNTAMGTHHEAGEHRGMGGGHPGGAAGRAGASAGGPSGGHGSGGGMRR